MRHFLLAAALAGLVLTGIAVSATAISAKPTQAQQTQQSTKMVMGKVTSIGTGGTTFGLETSDTKQTMQFLLDKNAKVQGNVKVGTAVTVEYAEANGQNLALAITAQG